MGLLTYATLLTDYLPDVAETDTDAEAVLGRALNRVESLIATELRYPGAAPAWASTSYTLRLCALRSQRDILVLPVAPVTAIASVYQDENMEFGAETAVLSADYEREDLRHGALLHLLPDATSIASWSTTPRAVKVSCTAGYANEAAIPKALADAAYRTVADWWTGRRTRTVSSESAGGASQTFRDLVTLPADVRLMLAPWRLLGSLGAS